MAISPKTFGLIFEPPQLTLVYRLDGKLRKRTMPVRDVSPTTDPQQAAQAMMESHPAMLSCEIVSDRQLTRLMVVCEEGRGATTTTTTTINNGARGVGG